MSTVAEYQEVGEMALRTTPSVQATTFEAWFVYDEVSLPAAVRSILPLFRGNKRWPMPESY